VQVYGEPTVYERFDGAAAGALAPGYKPRTPHQSVLHRVVREHLLTFLAEGVARSHDGQGYPFYVEKELRSYLDCGDMSRGFARVVCARCRYELLLPFSCKNRGICPSCTSRRMSDEAAYLVDLALPRSRYRQWTVTFPWPIRYLMAKDYRLITAVMRIVMQVLFAWQRKMARRAGHRDVRTLAVAFIQRYGGAINANVHGHVVMPDAVFVVPNDDEAMLQLVELAPPTDADVEALVARIARRVTAMIEKRLATVDDRGDSLLDSAVVAAMQTCGTGSAPRPDAEADQGSTTKAHASSQRRASIDGFSLHANTQTEPDDRAGLERLCRYGLRPAFSHERLTIGPDGKVHYRLRRPWPNPAGASMLTFEPVDFLRRLVPLIPPPYANLIRHYGLLAPNAKHRHRLPPAPVSWTGAVRPESLLAAHKAATASSARSNPEQTSPTAISPLAPQPAAMHPESYPSPRPERGPGPRREGQPPDDDSRSPDSEQDRRRKPLPWRELLRRVFSVDVLICPICSAPLTVIAYLNEPHVVRKILAHLQLPTASPPLGPARCPEEQLDFAFDDQLDIDTESDIPTQTSSRSRAPPTSTPSSDPAQDWTVERDHDWGA